MNRVDARSALPCRRMAAGVALWVALAATPARPDYMLGIVTDSFLAGSSANFQEVTLTDTDAAGSAPLSIGSFAFEITAAGPNVTFSDVEASDGTFAYIFPAANSAYGPHILLGVSPDGHTVEASDSVITPNSGTALAPGQTISLGLVEFALAGGTPSSPIAIAFISNDPNGGSGTSLSDSQANTIPFSTDPNAAITPMVNVVPEPSSLSLVLSGLIFAAILGRRALRRRSPGPELHLH